MEPRELSDRLKNEYSTEIPYHRVFRGKERAMDIIYGKWADSYNLLPTYQAELLRVVPGSIVDIDTEKDDNGDVCFRRFFVALKPCIDDFLLSAFENIGVVYQECSGRRTFKTIITHKRKRMLKFIIYRWH